MFYAFCSHSCPPYKNHQKTKRGGISPLRSIFPMFVFFLMPFGMVFYCLDKSRSARAVVLALLNLLLILLFVRAVVIEHPATINSTFVRLCLARNSSISFAYWRSMLVPHTLFFSFRSSLFRSSYFLRLLRTGVSGLRSILHLSVSRYRADDRADKVHDASPDQHDAHEQRFQQAFPYP